jgi:predicted RNA-binding protein
MAVGKKLLGIRRMHENTPNFRKSDARKTEKERKST